MNLDLKTERLVLRPLGEDDLALAIELRTNPEVMKYIAGLGTAETISAKMHEFCCRSEDGSMGIWSVTVRENGEKIGTCILLPLPVEESDTRWDFHENGRRVNEDVEVGYMLKPAEWGKGYATEMTRRLLQFAFEQTELSSVVAVTDPANSTSQHVLRKSGLRDVGTCRAYGFDLPGFRITKEQWLADQRSR